MGNSWFGSLALATKFGLVFGCLLGAVFVLGLIRVIYDKKIMKKHMNAIDLEGGEADKDSNKDLVVREKDEGELFGVRAIEAGYYGGVVQSRGNSVVNSPIGSRVPSLVDLSKANFGQTTSPTGYSSDRTSRPFSAGSSILRLSQFGPGGSMDALDLGILNESRPSSEAATSERISQHRRSSEKSPPVAALPMPEQSRGATERRRSARKRKSLKLRPSTAERNKEFERTRRHTHNPSTEIGLQLRPPPLPYFPRYSQLPNDPPSPLLSNWLKSPSLSAELSLLADVDKPRNSRSLVDSALFREMTMSGSSTAANSQQSLQEAISPTLNPPKNSAQAMPEGTSSRSRISEDLLPQLSLPEDIGSDVFGLDMSSFNNDAHSLRQISSSDEKEQSSKHEPRRASVKSWGTSFHSQSSYNDRHSNDSSYEDPSSTGRSSSPSPPPQLLDASAPSSRLPAFPKRAVIDSSNSRFAGLRQERSPRISPHSEGAEPSSYLESKDLEQPQQLSESPKPPLPEHMRQPGFPRVLSFTGMPYNDETEDEKNFRPSSIRSRSSFSYAQTDPDYHRVTKSPSPRKYQRIGDTPMSSMVPSKFEPLELSFYAQKPPKRESARTSRVPS